MAKGEWRKTDLGPYEETSFKTIEFGFSPFVPFTEMWEMMVHGGRTGGDEDFKVHADSQGGKGSDVDWEEKMSRYGMDTLIDNVENLPEGNIKQKTGDMAEELANLLQGEHPIYSQYEADQTAELEDLITMDWLFDSDNQWAWQGNSWKTPGVDVRREIGGKSITGAVSHETIDMMGKSERSLKHMEYVMHRIAANLTGGADFVSGAVGIEVSKMAGEKYTQWLFNNIGNTVDMSDRWDEVLVRLETEFMDQYRGIMANGQRVRDILEIARMDRPSTLGGTRYVGGGRSGFDTLEYQTKQMLDRFADISQRVTDNLAVYIWQNPLSWTRGAGNRPAGVPGNTTLIGFARFEADLDRQADGSVYISGMRVTGQIVDIAANITEAGFSSEREYKDLLESASNTTYGTLSQFLLWDRMRLVEQGNVMLHDGSHAIGLGLGKWSAYNSQIGEMLGSSARYQVDNIARGVLDAGSVEAVQVLSSSEVAKGVKAQFDNFFGGSEVNRFFKEWQEKAQQSSVDVTRSWKNMSTSNRPNLAQDANVWPPEGKLFEGDGIQGSRVGLPWFFYSGEDPMGWTRFNIRELDRLVLANLRMDERQAGIGLTPEKQRQWPNAAMGRADAEWQKDYGFARDRVIGPSGIRTRFRGAGAGSKSAKGKMGGAKYVPAVLTGAQPVGGNWYAGKTRTPRYALGGERGKLVSDGAKAGTIEVRKKENWDLDALDWSNSIV